jgi:hypothetical protein
MRIQAQQARAHRLWTGFLLSIFCATIALGQAATGNIRGAVTDPNGEAAQIKPLPQNPTLAQTAACTFRHSLLNNTDPATTRPVCAPRTPLNQPFPLITLPGDFSNGDTLITTDLRLTRLIKIGEKARLSVIGEVFNLFNIANLDGYNDNLQALSFGTPTTRANQVFGSGGPRAFQLAARIGF